MDLREKRALKVAIILRTEVSNPCCDMCGYTGFHRDFDTYTYCHRLGVDRHLDDICEKFSVRYRRLGATLIPEEGI